MDRVSRLKLLKLEIDSFVKSGGNIQDVIDRIPYYNHLRSFLRNDRRNGLDSTIASVYKECGYNYVEKKSPLTIERVKSEIDEYVANGGSIFDSWDSLPYRNTLSSFIMKNKDWTVKKVYEVCGYQYRDKAEANTIERIKREIDEYVASGGSIYDPRDKLPYVTLVGHYIQNHKEENLSFEKIYKLCGYDYKPKRVPITVERIKNEIDKFVENGGNIYDSKENIPYYELMIWFIDRNKRHGIEYSLEDVYKLCGYEYNSIYYNTYKLGAHLSKYKDEDGYIDSLKNSDFGRKLYDKLQDKALDLQLDVNDYLMCMYGVRVSNSYTSVDYIDLVEKQLEEYEKKYGYEKVTVSHISDHDMHLYDRIRHLALYFPEGSVTMGNVLDFFGYNSNEKQEKIVNEKAVIELLKMIYPDKNIKGLSYNRMLYTRVIKLSTYNNQTVEQYLKSKGFNVFKSQDAYRLSRAKLAVDDEKYKKICDIRKKLIKKSNVLNNPSSTIKEINKELEKIGVEVVKEMKIDKKAVFNKLKK